MGKGLICRRESLGRFLTGAVRCWSGGKLANADGRSYNKSSACIGVYLGSLFWTAQSLGWPKIVAEFSGEML